MPKHILYLTYYYPPCNSVSAYRPYSHVKSFIEKGHKVTVITRAWDGNEKGWVDYCQSSTIPSSIVQTENLTVHYIQYFKHKELSKQLFSKFKFFKNFIFGNFHLEIDAFHCFEKTAFQLCNKHKFDAIIISSPPLNQLKLANKLSKKHKLKIVADFRDLWDSNLLIKNYKFTLSERVKNYFFKFHFNKWTKKTNVKTTTVSEKLAEILGKYNNTNVNVFYNGFEDEIINNSIKTEYEKFTISSIGTIYPYYKIDEFLTGFLQFVKNNNNIKDIQLLFIGANAVPEVANKIKSIIPEEFVKVTDRIAKEKAVEILKSSHVLYHSAVKEFEGAYTTKIFDYIGSGNKVLICPGDDNGIIDQLILNTNTGTIVKTANEVEKIIEKWYLSWKSKENINYNRNTELINSYSRSYQANRFTNEVLNWLEN